MKRLTRIVPLFVLAFSLLAEERALTLLHVNDLHAQLMPNEKDRGGFARLAAAIERETRGCTTCLVFNVGDLVQGTPVSTLYKGLPVYELARLLHFDVATLGNHDFDYGVHMTQQFIKKGKFPVVTANVVDGHGILFTGRPYLIRNVNGLRVAVIGSVMGHLEEYEEPAKLGNWHSLPVVETLRRYAAELKDRADVIVLLAHSEEEEQAAALHEVPEINVVLGGHVHEALKDVEVDGKRIWVRGISHGRELNRVELKVDVPTKQLTSWTWKRIPIDANIPPQPKMAAQVAKWEKRVSKVVDVRIGEAKRELAGPELRAVLERAMAAQTGADFGLLNQGGIRGKLPQGAVLARHIWVIMPFDDGVVSGKFKGSELPKAVREAHQVDPDKEYTLVTSNYIAETGGMGTKGMKFPNRGPILRDLLVDWVKKVKVVE